MANIVKRAYDTAVKAGISAMESNLLPDLAVRPACRYLMSQRIAMSRKGVEEQQQDLMSFIKALKSMPIAVNTLDANEQHYEVPTEFYKLCLGKNLKYSACYFPSPSSTLDEAEDFTLKLYCERAHLNDGQKVLELGCGWGSLSLFMAAKYPASSITGVSNSATQKEFIEQQCRERKITNLTIVTADMNDFEIDQKFDRIVSVEMFEHMKNYQKLLKKVSSWLESDGFLFVHIFTHKDFAYHFEDNGDDDWLTRYFFSGGTMPSDNLLLYFQDDLSILRHWRLSGTHYQRTSEAWLKNFDKNIKKIREIFEATYGADQTTKWVMRWRTFFISVAELFGYSKGNEWIVSHYLFRKKEIKLGHGR